MTFRLELDPIVVDRVATLSASDRLVVAENVLTVKLDPKKAGRPSGLKRAKQQAWQHVCPHSFVVLYRWVGGDPRHPDDVVTIEDLVDRL